MIVRNISALLLISLQINCSMAVEQPNPKQDQICIYQEDAIENIRQLLVDKNVSKVSELMEYPINAVLVGKITTIKQPFLFSKYYFDEKFLEKIKALHYCELGKAMNVDPKSGKIRNLVIGYDEDDSIFASSGITSAKALRVFVKEVISLSKQKKYSDLSQKFRYPFYIESSQQRITISDKESFLANANLIANDGFIKLLEDKFESDSFIKMPRGLMLTKEGDVWIVPTNAGLLLEINGGVQ